MGKEEGRAKGEEREKGEVMIELIFSWGVVIAIIIFAIIPLVVE